MSTKKNVDKKKDDKKDELKKKPKKEEQRIKKEFPLPPQPKNFKQIEFNQESGILFLIDYNNDIFECNLYGEKNPQFHLNITGISNYSTRLKKNLIEEVKLIPEPESYFPQISKFEGYFPYPRPISLPFSNEVHDPSMLINQVKKEERYNENMKVKKLFELKIPSKDNNCLLTYMSSSVSDNDNSVKLHLIKLINEYIEEKIKENPFNENIANTDHSIIALRRFRKILKSNLGKNEINGKKLPLPKKEFKIKYDLMKKVMRKQGLNKMHSTSQNVNFDIYKELYSVRNVGKEDYIFKPHNLQLLGNLDNIDNIYEYLNKRDKEISLNKTQYTTNTNVSKSNENQTKTTGFDIKFQTARSKFFPNKTSVTFNKISSKENDNENLSILSLDDNLIKTKPKIKLYKTLKEIKHFTERDNRLLKGFEYPEYKEPPIFKNKYKPVLLTPGEIYQKETDLLKKVNPIAFKKEEDKELFDLKVLKKKKQSQKVFERLKLGKN